MELFTFSAKVVICFIVVVLTTTVTSDDTPVEQLGKLAAADVSPDSELDFSPLSTLTFTSFGKEGVPGVDFPNNTEMPYGVLFSCRKRPPGFYANPQAGCQVYHQCLPDGRVYNFLCGIGTIFNQKAFICDHWYNYNCDDAEEDYKYNDIVFGKLFFQTEANKIEVTTERILQIRKKKSKRRSPFKILN